MHVTGIPVQLPCAQAEYGIPASILGNNLKGNTSVAFNGTTATFKVIMAMYGDDRR
jgi:hypothetical protein